MNVGTVEGHKPFMKDVTGFTLEEALRIFKEEGVGEVEVKLTTAPRKAGEEYRPQSRVVRQKAVDTEVRQLIVCNLESSD